MIKIILPIFVIGLLLIASITTATSFIGNNILKENLDEKNNNHKLEKSNELPVAEWTVIAYLAGDMLGQYCVDQFLTMVEVGSTDEVHITAQLDRASSDTRRYYVTKGMDPDDASAYMDLGEANMGDPQTLIDFASWSINNYPAKRYCLVFVNHGGGWYGVCWDNENDENKCDKLDMWDLQYALSTITCNGENPIDLICFDACVMAWLEVAYEIAPYSSYMTASQSTINPPDWGLHYDKTLACLIKSPTMHPETLGGIFVNNFTGNTLSTLNLSLVNSLKDAVNDLGISLQDEVYVNDSGISLQDVKYLDEILNAIDNVSFSNSYLHELYHFVQLLQQYIDDNEIDIKTQTVMNLINNTVTSKKPKSTENNIHGININLIGKSGYYGHKYWIYDPSYETISFAKDTQWDEFIIWYLSFINTNPPEIPEINGPSSGEKEIPYNYTFSTMDSDADFVYLYVDWGDGTNSGWLGPYGTIIPDYAPETVSVTLKHTWAENGLYEIRAKAKDIFNLESDWGILDMIISKNVNIQSSSQSSQPQNTIAGSPTSNY